MKNGFTLIELLGILVLLGIIVIVAVPAVIESNKTSNENKIKELKAAINTACETYATINKTAINNVVSVQELINQGYLKKDVPASEKSKSYTIHLNSNKQITCID